MISARCRVAISLRTMSTFMGMGGGMVEKEVTRERRAGSKYDCRYYACHDGPQTMISRSHAHSSHSCSHSQSQPRLHLATQSPHLPKQSIGICPYAHVYLNRDIASSSPSSSSWPCSTRIPASLLSPAWHHWPSRNPHSFSSITPFVLFLSALPNRVGRVRTTQSAFLSETLPVCAHQ